MQGNLLCKATVSLLVIKLDKKDANWSKNIYYKMIKNVGLLRTAKKNGDRGSPSQKQITV